MTETQQTAVVGDIHPDVPMAINSKFATIAIYGHELVSKRDIELLALVINSLNHDAGVRSVVFRADNSPKDQMMNCCPDTMSIAINLKYSLVKAIEACIEKPEISIFSQFYVNLLFNYFHEISHLYSRITEQGREDLESMGAEDEEDACNIWATEQLLELAKAANIEPPNINEIPGLAQDILQLIGLTSDDNAKEDPWVTQQAHMLENRIFYDLPEDDGEESSLPHKAMQLNNFKSVCRSVLRSGPRRRGMEHAGG